MEDGGQSVTTFSVTSTPKSCASVWDLGWRLLFAIGWLSFFSQITQARKWAKYVHCESEKTRHY